MKSKQFLVIGVGRFGSAVATSLFQSGHEVVAVDIDEARIDAVMDRVTHAMIVDASDPAALEELGVSNFDAVVVAIGSDFEANILATLGAKSGGAKHVLSKAVSDSGATVLSRVGADEVVRPEHDMGLRVARKLTSPELVDAFNLGEKHSVIEVVAHRQLTGRLDELRLPNKYGVQVIAIQRSDAVHVSPGASFEVLEDDRLVLIGDTEAIERFESELAT